MRSLSAIRGALENDDRVNSGIHSHAMSERVWRYLLPGHGRANLEAVLKRVWRCTWQPWSCELAGHDQASLTMHLEAVIT